MTQVDREIVIIIITAFVAGFVSLAGKYMWGMITGGKSSDSEKEGKPYLSSTKCPLHDTVNKDIADLEKTDESLYGCMSHVKTVVQSVEVTSAKHDVLISSMKEKQDHFEQTVNALKRETDEIKKGQDRIHGKQNELQAGINLILEKIK